MNFFDLSFVVTGLVLACYVAPGEGDAAHKNRPSHGLALHLGGKKHYVFSDGKKLDVGQNDLIFLPRESTYTVRSEKPGGCYAINFQISQQDVLQPFVLHLRNPAPVLSTFQAAERAFRIRKSDYSWQCMRELYAALCLIKKEYEAGYAPNSLKNKLLPAVEYIHMHYTGEMISVETLSALCGVSSAYFRRSFSACYGTSPVKYINQLKLSRACDLLRTGEYSVEAVCEAAGFMDVSYFCRFFKKQLHMTPTEYRQRS